MRLAAHGPFFSEEPVAVKYALRDEHGRFYFITERKDKPFYDTALLAYPKKGGAPRWRTALFSENFILGDSVPAVDKKFLYVSAKAAEAGINPACGPCDRAEFHVMSLKDGSLDRRFVPRFCGRGAHWKKGGVIYSLAFLSPFDEDRHPMLHATSTEDGSRLWDAWTVVADGHGERCCDVVYPPEKIVGKTASAFDGELAAFSERRGLIYAATKFRYTIYVHDLNGREIRRIGPGTEWDVTNAFMGRMTESQSFPIQEVPSMLMNIWTLGGDVLAVERISEEKKMILDLWRHDGTLIAENVARPRGGKIFFSWKDALYLLGAEGPYYKEFQIHEYRLKRKYRR